MAVSGLIITFSSDCQAAHATTETLRKDPRIQVGDAFERRLPIVVETSDANESGSLWEWLYSLPGIVFIDVAYLHFDEGADIQGSAEIS